MKNGVKNPQKSTLNRFLKSKTAVFGIFIISIGLFLSIFAYPLIPDKTPYAKLQIAELPMLQ